MHPHYTAILAAVLGVDPTTIPADDPVAAISRLRASWTLTRRKQMIANRYRLTFHARTVGREAVGQGATVDEAISDALANAAKGRTEEELRAFLMND